MIQKFIRFVFIYGFTRTWVKALGRLRTKGIKRLYIPRPGLHRNVSIIGCGQFAFSTIGYFLAKHRGKVFLNSYDPSRENLVSFSSYYNVEQSADPASLMKNDDLEVLYIASNHASHTDYAVSAMKSGIKKIHIEKPICTNYDQLISLLSEKNRTESTLFAGYNRPFAKAIKDIKKHVKLEESDRISVLCFINGHKIAPDNWYRHPEEGTRVCGNLGHWIDLCIHILAWRKLPNRFDFHLAYSDLDEPDDNFSLTMTSDLGDLLTMTLCSLTEPYEGIRETIHLQTKNTIATIDDFQRLSVWQGPKRFTKKYFPKDVGHRDSILQAFNLGDSRDWNEVVISTYIMLHVADLVRRAETKSTIHIDEFLKTIDVETKSH